MCNDINVIHEIRENPDGYTPNQITCFNRPWAILFASIRQDYYYMFLFWTTFYQLFMIDDYFDWRKFENNLDENFLEYANNILSEKFGCVIEKVNVTNNLNEKIRECIDKKYRVLLPVDLVRLPYYSDYMNKKHVHFMPIKGYDSRRKLYYILDNMHMDRGAATTYSDFTLTWNCVADIFQAIFVSLFNGKDKFFWVLRQTERLEYNLEILIREFRDLLDQINKGEKLIKFA